MIKENFIQLYAESLAKNWDLPAVSDYHGDTFTYGEMAAQIARLHILLEQLNVQKGDKIAVFGRNSARWCTSFLSVITHGAIVVPILPDFKPEEVHNIVNHSDSVILFVDKQLMDTLSEESMPAVNAIFAVDDFSVLSANPSDQVRQAHDRMEELFREKYPDGFTREHIDYARVDNKEVVEINYTSGTTGFSKGVVLSANSLAGNVTYAQRSIELNPGEKMITVLPLAHCYANAFDFLFPLTVGVHITILGKIPATPLLLKAFDEVKPHLVMFIPLFLEKMYKKRLLPTISKGPMKVLLAVPGIRNILYGVIRKKLIKSFGGRFREIVLGGAPLSAEVEAFYRKIRFPFTIGYGMTECGPLISYDGYRTSRKGSAGIILDVMELRIDSGDPYREVGEILVRGENLMEGYYKNEEATRNAIDEEGWLHTGDLGVTDSEGYVYIKGRSKSMLLGPSGQNIYPEEIEARLNNLPYIAETVVLMNENHKLEVLVHPDMDAAEADGVKDRLKEVMEENRKMINQELKGYENIFRIHIHESEFEKTPKRSIKRFLYSLEDLKK